MMSAIMAAIQTATLRAAEPAGRLFCRPILRGLHHQYTRI
jgi:hypothetical protein